VFHNKRGDGKFYLYYTDSMPDKPRREMHKQIGAAVADNPLGPFTDQGVLVPESIDADLFEDDDGSLYLYYVELAGGFKIFVQPMADPLHKKGERKVIMRPTEEWEKRSGEVTEGPFMLKHKDTYYLIVGRAVWVRYAGVPSALTWKVARHTCASAGSFKQRAPSRILGTGSRSRRSGKRLLREPA
jgi:GH43 family beta-xylosidase